MKEPNTIYVVRHKNMKDYVKIGITSNFEKRLASLDTASPFGIETVYRCETQNDVRRVERAIHSHFSKYHARLEWYKLDEPEQIVEIIMEIDNLL